MCCLVHSTLSMSSLVPLVIQQPTRQGHPWRSILEKRPPGSYIVQSQYNLQVSIGVFFREKATRKSCHNTTYNTGLTLPVSIGKRTPGTFVIHSQMLSKCQAHVNGCLKSKQEVYNVMKYQSHQPPPHLHHHHHHYSEPALYIIPGTKTNIVG